MSKDSFKVKKGLSIIPVDPTTLVSPEAGDLVVDSTDNNKLKSYDPISATFKQVKGTGGGINYLENGDAESGLSGWSTYADAAGANAVDGTGGTANITLTLNDVNPLRGTNDFLITKDAANRQGEGISIPFTIDSADTAKKLYISLDFLSSANLADGDIRIQVYDVTNSVLIRCNGEDLNGTKGSHLAWFQSDAVSVSYRLILHVSSVNATAYTLNIDNVSVGPRDAVMVSSRVVLLDSSGNAGQAITADVTNIPFISNFDINSGWNGSQYTVQRSGDYFVNGSVGFNSAVNTNSDVYVNGTKVKMGGSNTSVSSHEISVSLRNLSKGDIISIRATGGGTLFNTPSNHWLTIWGEDSNRVSEDIGNREVRVRGAGNAGTAITANVTDITFTEVEDTTASWSGTQFTAPETGDYSVSGSIATVATIARSVFAFIGGLEVKNLGTGSEGALIFSGTVSLIKGQIFSLRCNATTNLVNSPSVHHIHIQKLAQPQTLLETETVAASYSSNSGQVVATSANIIYEDKDFDTHGTYNISTGEYTAPVSGNYIITASGFSTVAEFQISIVIDGVQKADGYLSGAATGIIKTSYIGYVSKGQIVSIQNRLGLTRTLVNTNKYNTFSIAKIK